MNELFESVWSLFDSDMVEKRKYWRVISVDGEMGKCPALREVA
jgi:hypothetical protein